MPVKALFHDEDGKEIIVITQFEATMQDGTVVADETAAYYTMEDIDGQILVSRLKVYMVITMSISQWMLVNRLTTATGSTTFDEGDEHSWYLKRFLITTHDELS